MEKINKEEYQIEEKDVVGYLRSLKVDDEIDVSYSKDCLTAKIVTEFCKKEGIDIDYIEADFFEVTISNGHGFICFKSPYFFYYQDIRTPLLKFLRLEHGERLIYTVKEILSYFKQK